MEKVMRKILTLAVFAVAVVTAFAILPNQNQKQTKVQEQHDLSSYPVADYESSVEPSDFNLRRFRESRGKRHNIRLRASDNVDVRQLMITERSKSSWGGPPSHAPVEPALPATQSAAVIVGEVTNAQAYLSEDKTAIYSEFTVRIDEVLKNNSAVALAPNGSITTVRNGGAVRFPSGKVIQRGSGGKPFPLSQRKYVFFLSYESEGDDYPIITAYELSGGLVSPLDGIDIDGRLLEPYAGYQEYRGAAEKTFLNKVRDAIEPLAKLVEPETRKTNSENHGMSRITLKALANSSPGLRFGNPGKRISILKTQL
jgi:hypothetical protein